MLHKRSGTSLLPPTQYELYEIKSNIQSFFKHFQQSELVNLSLIVVSFNLVDDSSVGYNRLHTHHSGIKQQKLVPVKCRRNEKAQLTFIVYFS